MVRGLKKKLLIGLLSAAVVGTSLAPSVPLVGSFAQEVKADAAEHDTGGGSEGVENNQQTAPVYKYTAVTVTPEAATYKWPSSAPTTYYNDDQGAEGTILNDDPTSADPVTVYTRTEENGLPVYTPVTVTPEVATYKWPENKPETYFDEENQDTPGTKLHDDPTSADPVIVYTREVDTTKSKVTVTQSKDTKAEVTPKTIGSTSGSSAVIDKNKSTKITVDVEASAGKVIKSVVAKVISAATNKQIGSDITATKVDGTENTYELLVTATEDTVKVLISTEEEDLLITPKLSSTLSSKVGTAELTSTSAVKPGKKIELKVTLAEGATKDNVTVKANNQVVTGTLEDGVVTYSIDTTGVTDEELEIEVSGRLDNDGLDKTKTDKGSTATVDNTGDVAADANDVLNVAKSDQDGKYVNAEVRVSSKDETTTTELSDEVALAEKSGLKLAGYISVDFFRTVSDTPGAAAAITGAENQKVTKLGAPLAVKYFLPKAAIGKSGYKAIRFHDTIGEITTTPNADGEYIEVKGNELILHVKLLSDFAVVYNDTDATPDVPDPVKPDDNKPSEEVKPSSGTTATTSTTSAATSTTKAAKATTSTKKSSKTSSPKTADYAVNSLLALLTGAAGLFGITLINKKRKEDEE